MSFRHLNNVPLVYFLQAEHPEGLIKIGSTQLLRSRFRYLQAANAVPIRILAVQYHDAPTVLEAKLHKKFRPFRHHGEWFWPDEKILDYVQRRAVPPNRPPPPKALDVPPNGIVTVEDLPDPKRLAPAVMTAPQLAAWLNVSVGTVRRLVASNRLPYLHVGSQIRFETSKVWDILKSGKLAFHPSHRARPNE